MSTALEVMQAIVENGGPKEMWVSKGATWTTDSISGVDLSGDVTYPISSVNKTKYRSASLTDPNENDEREVCPNCGAKEVGARTPRTVYACDSSDYDQLPGTFRQGHDCINRKRTTRPMTAREFANFVEDNRGKFLYHDNGWYREFWQSHINVDAFTRVENYLYAHNVPGELYWEVLPQMEAE